MKRYDLARALAAVRLLLKNPKDINYVFEIADALPGYAFHRASKRLTGTPFGTRLMTEQERLRNLLSDRPRLAAMPPGSLAHAYLRFMEEEQITAGGLVDADAGVRSDKYRHIRRDAEAIVWEHFRDTHDLWHAVTGYHGDYLGEPALQAFSFAQTFMPGSGFIVLMVYLQTSGHLRSMIREGFRRGRASAWLLAEDWAALLPLPLEEVRCRLRVPPLTPYTPLRTLESLLHPAR